MQITNTLLVMTLLFASGNVLLIQATIELVLKFILKDTILAGKFMKA